MKRYLRTINTYYGKVHLVNYTPFNDNKCVRYFLRHNRIVYIIIVVNDNYGKNLPVNTQRTFPKAIESLLSEVNEI